MIELRNLPSCPAAGVAQLVVVLSRNPKAGRFGSRAGHLAYFVMYIVHPCFWPKLAGKKIFPFNILIQYFIYLYLGTKPIIFQNIILHMDIIIAFQSYTFNV